MDPLTRPVKPIRHRAFRKPLSEEVHRTYRALVTTLILLTISITAFFLYTNSLKPAQGYRLEQLQADYEALQSDQRRLNQKVIEAQAFVNLGKNELLQDMQALSNSPISYAEESGIAQSSNHSGTGTATQ